VSKGYQICSSDLYAQNFISRKTEEISRLLSLKSNAKISDMGDYARSIICIELATTALGQNFELATAYKLAGLRRSAYTNNKRLIEKLLDLNNCIGINEICVKLGLNQVQQTAVTLLNQYKATGQKAHEDLDHPQYAAIAIYFACRQHKLKPPKQKLMPLSHLRPSQWTVLETVWDKWLQQQQTESRAKPTTKQAEQDIMDCADIKEAEQIAVDKPEVETFEIWQERILRKAYADLEAKRSKS
jgi:origin recognition complex subunit 6